jgi:hypothetical protein
MARINLWWCNGEMHRASEQWLQTFSGTEPEINRKYDAIICPLCNTRVSIGVRGALLGAHHYLHTFLDAIEQLAHHLCDVACDPLLLLSASGGSSA